MIEMKRIAVKLAYVAAALLLLSCNNLEITMPQGPRGPKGEQGTGGMSAYEIWVTAVGDGTVTDWNGGTTISDYFIYLKGKDGKDGQDGLSAYEVWKEYISTGNVDDPQNPGSVWSPDRNTIRDFFIFLTGADGDDGLTPFVGSDGNWWIGVVNTGVLARGQKGEKGDKGDRGSDGLSAYEYWKECVEKKLIEYDGETSIVNYFKYISGSDGADGETPFIGDNGNWWIGPVDTGVPAAGKDGKDGKDGRDGKNGRDGSSGLSAYEVWKSQVLSDEGLANPGNGIFSLEDFPLWPKDRVEVSDFWAYLHGSRGLSAYEVWVEYISGGDADDPRSPGKKWNPADSTVQDYYIFLTGPAGDDGLVPFIGDNGNWWIGTVDTGVPAKGRDGVDGKDGSDGRDGKDGADGNDGSDGVSPTIGDNGNWWIGSVDTGVPAVGQNGKDGSDGKDGKDGSDGLSAYEIWKTQVLSDGGLENPGNGIYDIDDYPLWPKDKVSLADFWDYLKGKNGSDGEDGKDGKDGKDGETRTEYSENTIPGLYNLAPVNALMVIGHNPSTMKADTTYESVNPFTGGAAFIVTASGGAILPDCEVTFTDLTGSRTYVKTSDKDGFIYLTRDELPEFKKGNPSAFDSANAVKPKRFVFNGSTVTDESEIARTCVVPYRVELEFVDNEYQAELLEPYYNVVAWSGRVRRIVEGKESVVRARPSKSSQAVMGFGSSLIGYNGQFYGFFNYMSATDRATNEAAVAKAAGTVDGKKLLSAGAFSDKDISESVRLELNRPEVSDNTVSNIYKTMSYGDGPEPSLISVHYVGGAKNSVIPDYGTSIVSPYSLHLPEIREIGDIDVSGSTGSNLSFNGKNVTDLAGESAVNVNLSNYELVIGKTSFAFGLNSSSFGQCYVNRTSVSSLNGGKVIEFQRFDSLDEFLKACKPSVAKEGLMSEFSNTGLLNGSTIDNKIQIFYTADPDGSISFYSKENKNKVPCMIRNVYDNFQLAFSISVIDVGGKQSSVSYAPARGTFHYVEGEYKATPEFNEKTYTIQTIIDGKTDPSAY